MELYNLVDEWSETIAISIPGAINKFGEKTYTTSSIEGRLVEIEEEKLIKNGEKVISKAKLHTTTLLEIDTKIGDYKIVAIKKCKNENNVIKFYKYWLV